MPSRAEPPPHPRPPFRAPGPALLPARGGPPSRRGRGRGGGVRLPREGRPDAAAGARPPAPPGEGGGCGLRCRLLAGSVPETQKRPTPARGAPARGSLPPSPGVGPSPSAPPPPPPLPGQCSSPVSRVETL